MDDLPDGTSANPLAPPKKGRCSAAKNVSFVTAEALTLTLPKRRVGAPPPYTAPSGDLVPPVSVIAQYFISKVTIGLNSLTASGLSGIR